MSERDGYEHGVPCWVDLWTEDADRAAAFYAPLFGWEIVGGAARSEIRHLLCRRRGRDVAAIGSRADAPGPPAWGTYVWVDDLEATAATAIEAGGRFVIEPFSSLDGGRMAVLIDPLGAVISLWQPGEHRGAELVNEPGAWSMSALMARDIASAERFYGALFGWRAETFEIGDAEGVLWRLDGYVGGEPEQPVPRDVVATMLPLGDEAAPAHWSVDFWIDGVDRAVAAAPGLGGTVVTPPYDIPGTALRQAVLADPDGATFSVTQVVIPEGID
ncbi:MAG: VOC family protein [Solirubrobacterales bacterium]